MPKNGLSLQDLYIDAEIARARLEHLVAEADNVTILWLNATVMNAVDGTKSPLSPLVDRRTPVPR